ncbi:MAG: hypothetical protein ACR2NG_04420 [Acidimicrobiia bacterium]
MDGVAIAALGGLIISLLVRARWVDSVFVPPWRTAKLVGVAIALALAIFYPLGWAAVVVVTGAMLLEPIVLRRPPGGNDRADDSIADQE